jgi:C-terminal processing protease CtpA/Prc
LVSAVKGRTTIELIKKESSPLGLTISGGIDKDGKPKVAQLKQGSLAQKADVLEIGDILLGINGIKTAGLKHEHVIDLIKQVGDQLTLDIEYDLPKWRMYNHKFFFFFLINFYSNIIIYSHTCN